MKYIFTLSGNSDRFVQEGFITKPLIKIKDKLVIEYVMDIFPGIDFKNVTFIVNDKDVNAYNIDKVLKKLYPESTVIPISSHTKGPVSSILKIKNKIENNEPYIVSYCDLTYKWDYTAFINEIIKTNCDGCLVTHSGIHPHRIRNINFAHLKLSGTRVLDVKEKGYYTDNPIDEYASSGVYYFKTGRILKKYFNKLIENNEMVNGEYYVTLVYNQMIKDGLHVIHYPTDNYVCLGTPHELISFKYWKSFFDSDSQDSEIDFIKSYWKKYHDSNKK